MGGWGCSFEAEGICRRVDGACCRPGMKGCVLAGKVTFPDGRIPAPVWPDEDGAPPPAPVPVRDREPPR
ncbi:MAG: hypothetical protein QM767_18885 [Anaeromyxobacter sp.]